MEFTRSGRSQSINTELYMGGSCDRRRLWFVEEEKDLGVTLSRNLKFSTHIKIQINKATAVLGQLRRTFNFWTTETFKTLYCAYVRPHLEYASVVWANPSKKDINAIEKVQRRATKLVPRIRNWTYEDRLAVLCLDTLQERRIRGDMIQFFKLSKGINQISWTVPPVPCNSLSQTGPAQGIRGHLRRISGQSSNHCSQRFNFFTNRVVNEWNGLPREVIEVSTVNQFKNRYDAYKDCKMKSSQSNKSNIS